MAEAVSLVKACREYFETEPHGRKFEIAEFKALTATDKAQLSDWLTAEGYELRRELAAAA